MKKFLGVLTIIFAAFLVVNMFSPLLHAAPDISGNICKSAGCGSSGPGLFEDGGVIRNIINILLFVIGVIAVIMLIIGGIRYAVSGGDPNSTKGAKDTILYAVIGIVVAFAAFAILNFVVDSITKKPAAAESSLIRSTRVV